MKVNRQVRRILERIREVEKRLGRDAEAFGWSVRELREALRSGWWRRDCQISLAFLECRFKEEE